VLEGQDRKKGLALRKVVSDEILKDPDTYNEAFLGKKPQEYVDWLGYSNILSCLILIPNLFFLNF
jgi:hypothetical protein